MNRPRTGVLLVSIGAMFSVLSVQVSAASQGSLYTYDLRSASATVANRASANGAVSMSLRGSWSSDPMGVLFSGNVSGSQSVGFAKPASGPTLDVSGAEAVGAGVTFTYHNICAADSQNVTQVGFFANKETQLKLQLSKCSSGKTFPECRFAGNNTPNGTAPVRSSLALQNGSVYRMICVKGADSGGRAPLTMEILHIDGSSVSTAYYNTFSIPATGTMRSSKYLSIANKYPLPSPSKNTDQLKSRVALVSYCKGNSITATYDCLDTELNQ